MTVVFVAPPLRGHYGVLYEAAHEWALAHPSVPVRFVFCGWDDVPLPVRGDAFLLPYTYLHASRLRSSEPDVFNAERADALEAALRAFVLACETPVDAIVYDFFCWEAARVGAQLRIPTWCSIPAVPAMTGAPVPSPPPASDAVARVSDACFVPGSAGQWLWTPAALLRDASLEHLGASRTFVRLLPKRALRPAARDGVYVCFGTVVPGNLYRQHPSGVRAWLACLLRTLDAWAAARGVALTVALPGPAELRAHVRARVREATRVLAQCDQRAELERCALFVTHGGGNAMREAIDAACPVLVVPFFGDQWDAAAHAVHTGVGTTCEALARPHVASTTWFAQTPSQQARECAQRLLHDALDRAFAAKHVALEQRGSVDAAAFDLDAPVRWHDGDVLLGHNADRVSFAAHRRENWRIGDARPFSQHGATHAFPRLLDQYNDVLRAAQRVLRDEGAAAYGARLVGLDAYMQARGVARPRTLDTPTEREQVWGMCLHGMDYLVQYHASHLHVVLSTYDAAVNEATRRELAHLQCHWTTFRAHVTFYTQRDGRLRRTPPPFDVSEARVATSVPRALLHTTERALRDAVERAPWHTRVQPAWNARLKDAHTAHADDVLGFRASYPYAAFAYDVAAWLVAHAPMRVGRQVVCEGGKSVYLYGRTPCGVACEVQLWPSVCLAAFQSEHDSVYKNAQLTAKQRAASDARRVLQTQLQQHVDRHAVLDIA